MWRAIRWLGFVVGHRKHCMLITDLVYGCGSVEVTHTSFRAHRVALSSRCTISMVQRLWCRLERERLAGSDSSNSG